jgi:hypothetical protein
MHLFLKLRNRKFQEEVNDGQLNETCQTLQSANHPDFSRDQNIINTFKVFGFSGKIAVSKTLVFPLKQKAQAIQTWAFLLHLPFPQKSLGRQGVGESKIVIRFNGLSLNTKILSRPGSRSLDTCKPTGTFRYRADNFSRRYPFFVYDTASI